MEVLLGFLHVHGEVSRRGPLPDLGIDFVPICSIQQSHRHPHRLQGLVVKRPLPERQVWVRRPLGAFFPGRVILLT